MSIWVRSQDKKTLVKADKLIIGYDKNEKVYEIHNVYDSLGTYKSKERAIEVLDEIQERISPEFNYEGNNEEVDVFIKTQMLNSMIAVYQMPEE